MDIVTFETAKKLHTAGFSQPEARYYQAWYDEYGILSIIITGEDYQYFAGVVFAPTATDILQELGDGYFLMLDGCFEIDQMSEQYGTSPAISRHENPAEAAALAYLKLKE